MAEHQHHDVAPAGTPEADPWVGRMNDPTSAACIKGLCGDEIEVYLVIEDQVITEARYFTTGCCNTRLCGRAVAERIQGRTIWDALAVSPRTIIDAQPELSADGRHCAILAVSTMYRAVADYLLKP